MIWCTFWIDIGEVIAYAEEHYGTAETFAPWVKSEHGRRIIRQLAPAIMEWRHRNG